MNKILIGAMALSLLGGTAVMAQTDNHDQGGHMGGQMGAQNGGPMGGDHRDNGPSGGDRRDDGRMGGDHRDDQRGGWHRGRLVCHYRHHHRVCYRAHW